MLALYQAPAFLLSLEIGSIIKKAMQKLRILIADDDPIIRLDLKQMLDNLGYDVVAEAGDGKLAVELAKETKPDLCILDVKMPVMDGIAAAERIAEIARSVAGTAAFSIPSKGIRVWCVRWRMCRMDRCWRAGLWMRR